MPSRLMLRGPVAGLDVRIAQELIEKARVEGVALVGEDGLLQQVTPHGAAEHVGG